jgi:hypothetical protein
MLLDELYTSLAPSFPASTRKDLLTATRVLAKALDCADPHHLDLTRVHQSFPSLSHTVETYLLAQGKRGYTIRNVKNNLSRFFRLAAAQGLFTIAPPQLTPRFDSRTRPPRRGTNYEWNNKTYLRFAQWPPDLQQAFHQFTDWATAPVYPGRPAHFRKRPTTIGAYQQAFEAYFGFLHHIQHLPTVTFDHLFDIALITQFVHWHVNELHHRPTLAIRYHLQRFITLTKQYRPLPDVRSQLLALLRTIPQPHPLYYKEDAWVSLATLDQIGRDLWPRQALEALQQKRFNAGVKAAFSAGLSLMLRLWSYVPFRQRNMREMLLNHNLYQNAQGQWRLDFRGDQLKIATRRGQLNTFLEPFPQALVPVLEEYLRVWRPVLLTKAPHADDHLFLSIRGIPFTGVRLRTATKAVVYRYTGQCWHPHNVRTVWATEMILKGVDLGKVAKMLNDDLKTVIANYAHLLNQNVAEEVYDIIDRHLGHGK